MYCPNSLDYEVELKWKRFSLERESVQLGINHIPTDTIIYIYRQENLKSIGRKNGLYSWFLHQFREFLKFISEILQSNKHFYQRHARPAICHHNVVISSRRIPIYWASHLTDLQLESSD